MSRYSSRVVLYTSLLPHLPVLLTTVAAWKDRTQAFTPFAPDLGYHITPNDFDAERRLSKLEDIAFARGGHTADIPGHPLLFGAFVDDRDLAPLGILEPDPRYETIQRFTPEAEEIVDRLHLIVEANGHRFASRPDWDAMRSGSLAYMEAFYPVDTGPLAVPAYMTAIFYEGLQLALPADPEALGQISARFVLLG